MHRKRVNEKAKDFKNSIIRLFKEFKNWRFIIIVSLLLAMTSAIFSLFSPNKLKDITNIITDGITPNTKVLNEISKKISNNFSDENILNNNINKIINSDKISEDEKTDFMNMMNNNIILNEKEKNKMFLSLPENILLELLDEININNVVISSKDKLDTIKVLSSLNSDSQEDLINKIELLPKSVYNLIDSKMNFKKIKNITIFLITLYLLGALFSYIEGISLATVSNKFAENKRNNIIKKINNLPLRYFDTHEIGDILSRITNDVDQISQNLNDSLSTLISSLTLFIGSIIMMFTTNWIMALTAILSSLLGFFFMGIVLEKSQKYFNQRQIELGNLNSHIEEIYSLHNIVKAYNGVDNAKLEFDKYNSNLYKCNQKSQFLSGLMPAVMGFIGNFGYVFVCVVGAILVLNNQITFGVIVAFMVYVRLFTSPLSQIAQATTRLQSTVAASERVFEFLDEEEMNDENNIKLKLDSKDVVGNITFDHVKFGYNSDKLIINDFNIKVKKGEKIAIVGPTGAGKTTIVNLLMKFYDINSGSILIDNIDTKKLSRDNIHNLFTMVLQDTWLFNGTIRDNIKFNRSDVNDNEILNALKSVGVLHFVKTLPKGLDFILDDNDGVSSGQKQLLTIARAMISDSPFLILDEATSNVDTRTEELVSKAMDKLLEGKTSFIIAHRLSTIKNADLILVLKNGDVIEKGSHEELIEKNGFYKELYNSQFKKETREVIEN